ncbi:MAG: hypothetical protein V7459_14365 [Oceanicoccus sp.]
MKFYKKSSFRTVLLALFATATFVGSAIFIFDVDAIIMLQFFLASIICLVLIIGAALVFSVLRILLKRWLG